MQAKLRKEIRANEERKKQTASHPTGGSRRDIANELVALLKQAMNTAASGSHKSTGHGPRKRNLFLWWRILEDPAR